MSKQQTHQQSIFNRSSIVRAPPPHNFKAAAPVKILCRFVSHHIPDELLPSLFKESARTLNEQGRLVFVDAVWAPSRPIARLIWRYDRGSFPRTEAALITAISDESTIESWERFAVFHQYVLGVAKPARPPRRQP